LNNGGFLVHLIDKEIEMTPKPNTAKAATDKLVKNICRKTRQTYSAKEKIRIALTGLRGEESISVLCGREDIAESRYYSWSKEFLEAGKVADEPFADPVVKDRASEIDPFSAFFARPYSGNYEAYSM
jgi:transposase-like protein